MENRRNVERPPYTANDVYYDLGRVLFRDVSRGGQQTVAGPRPDAPIVARLGDREHRIVGVAFEDGRVIIEIEGEAR